MTTRSIPDDLPTVTPDRSRLLTLDGLDKRTASYRETKRLIDEIETAIGGADDASPQERQMVQRAAVLGAIAQDFEAKYLLGRSIDFAAYCTVINAQRRAFDAIGYKRRQRDVTPTLESYLSTVKEGQ